MAKQEGSLSDPRCLSDNEAFERHRLNVNTRRNRLEGKGSGLTVLVISGGLIAVSMLLVVFLLILSGFLTIPFFLGVVAVLAALTLLGLSITTAVLSRRSPDPESERDWARPDSAETSDPNHS